MRVVIAHDGSQDSKAAVSAVSRLPFEVPPEITLVSAIVEPTFDLPQSTGAAAAERKAMTMAEERLEQAAQQLRSMASGLQIVVRTGHPSHIVLEAAEEVKADVIVVGARGHSTIARLLLGSTADYIANHAKCSVLVVRPRADLTGELPVPQRPPSVCLAYDGHPPSKIAFEQMLWFNWPPQTRVHIATMLERPSMLPDDVIYDEELLEQSRQDQNDLVSMANEKLRHVELTYTVRETTHVGAALRNVALRVEADYLFIGDTGKTALGRILLGSTSRYLLHHAECSIWLARRNGYAA
ncbi:MAG: universal stress protein [Pirellulaceae bacterium]|nr:MAG: universal stress protein [Pirellulaceae bacterium]